MILVVSREITDFTKYKSVSTCDYTLTVYFKDRLVVAGISLILKLI